MKIFFETHGCSYNQADTESIKSYLNSYESGTLKNADVIIINTCAVKNKTVVNLRARIKEIQEINPKAKIIFAGCLTQASKKAGFEIPEMLNYSMIGPNNIKDIQEVVNATIKSKIEVKLDDNEKQKDTPIEINSNLNNKDKAINAKSKPIEIIPISKGCLNNCTFCQTKLARGELVSFLPDEIISRIKKNVENGTKIFYLTSQDNGCYGFDFRPGTKWHKYDIADLVSDICKIDGEFYVRIGMANPAFIKKKIKKLIDVMKNEKVFKFLHIPLQAGSDKVLTEMRRGNTVEEFIETINYARKEILGICIATDIIVGYPTETNDDFLETGKILDKIMPDIVNRAKFSSRPGTFASTLKQLQTNEVSRRSKILNEKVLKISLENNQKSVGWKGKVIVEAVKRKGNCVARNIFYRPIVIEGNYNVGDVFNVEITDAETFHLIGKKINQN
jgi:threonylcarbamoyladenosine tRNA methylthiotransferase CDKAL1